MKSHQVISSFRNEYRFLSNFYPSRISHNGISYPTVEHAYQAQKTLDPLERIIVSACYDANAAKLYGRNIKCRPDWEDVKFDIMYQLLKLKFEIPELRQKLLDTEDAELIEGNTWGDSIWGCVRKNGKWVGANNLGKLLMRVRSECETN